MRPLPQHSPSHRVLRALALLLALAGANACSGDEAETTPSAAATAAAPELPPELLVPTPDDPVLEMEIVEDYSEEVANRMIDFSDKLRRRDFESAKAWLATDFAGHALHGLDVGVAETLPLGAVKREYDPASAAIVGGDGFLAAIGEWIGPWAWVETVQWKVKGAEFQSARPLWGRIRFRVTVLGRGEDGGPRSIVAWGYSRIERRGGQWVLTSFQLDSLVTRERAQALFTDVATSAGVAHTGIRFGQVGNDSFAWNGAAGGDADGDGLFDVFLPSLPSNFLYMAREEGGFADEAEERGVRAPAGGTGAVFFDYDNDGDQDLAIGDVGWKESDGSIGGNRLRLYTNGGAGKFAEHGKELGFDALCNAYSLVVHDAELDGFLDVFVCNYGRVEVEGNDSWTDAQNGMPNALYRNEAGKGFRNVAKEVGLVDTSWSYAGASSDFDLDGDQDLYVANDYGLNQLWQNRGDGSFEETAEAIGISDLGNGMGVAWGDLNADGRIDLYVANMSSTAGNRILRRLASQGDTWKSLHKMAAGNTLFLAGDDGAFRAMDRSGGGLGANWAWSPTLFDLDLDGRLDVYNANGFVTGDTAADT